MVDIVQDLWGHEVVTPEQRLAEATTAAEAAEEAIAQAEANASAAWKLAAYNAVTRCAELLPDFTADDVWERLANHTVVSNHEPAALGPIFLKAARDGLIRNTGQRRPTRQKQRHRDLTVWTAQ